MGPHHPLPCPHLPARQEVHFPLGWYFPGYMSLRRPSHLLASRLSPTFSLCLWGCHNNFNFWWRPVYPSAPLDPVWVCPGFGQPVLLRDQN